MSSPSSSPHPPLSTEAPSSPPPLSTGSSTSISSSTHSSITSSSPPLPPPSFPSTKKSRPFNISILHNKNIESAQQSPRRSSIATHLMNFASRSTTSLHLLSSSAPVQGSPAAHDLAASPPLSNNNINSSSNTHFNTFPSRASVMPPPRGGNSAFSNPFRKLQSSLQLGSKKSMEFASSSPPTSVSSSTSHNGQLQQPTQQHQERERVLSSSSSASSMISWRSKGAEMLSKKPWGRARKNSEPAFGKGTAADAGLPIFGANLEDAIRRSHIPGTPMVPAILYRCAEFLEAKGVDEVGLYRVPGSHASVQKLKRLFDTGADHNLLAMEHLDPNDIATLLKLYLRELPAPLLPAVILEQIQSILTTDRHICHTLRGILIRLPRNNYVVLSFLCHHLSKIANYAHKTKMSISNLGVVFAPTLSIGSVLFKALLGGFYDGSDTAESREKGLKIVWGGLLSDFEYSDGVDDGPSSASTAEVYAAEIVNAQVAAGSKQELIEDDEVVEANKSIHPLFVLNGPPMSASSRDLYPHPEMRTANSSAAPSIHESFSSSTPNLSTLGAQQHPPITISITASPTSTTPSSPIPVGTAEDEEARLMKSMLLAEAAAAASAANDGNGIDDEDGDDDLSTAVVSTATAVPIFSSSEMGTPAMTVVTTANSSGIAQTLGATPSIMASSTGPMVSVATAEPFIPIIPTTTTTSSSSSKRTSTDSKKSKKSLAAPEQLGQGKPLPQPQDSKPTLLLGEFFFESEHKKMDGEPDLTTEELPTSAITTTTTTAATTATASPVTTATALPSTSKTLPQLPPLERLSITL